MLIVKLITNIDDHALIYIVLLFITNFPFLTENDLSYELPPMPPP